MGAWGVLAYENDNAADWLWTLEEAEDLSVLSDALEQVISDDEIVENWEEALAAAEVVATLLGKPLPELPEEVSEFAKRNSRKPSPKLVDLAIRAVVGIRDTPNLRKQWTAKNVAGWESALGDLLKRLGP
jgi:3-methyladenine DNA glycosylase AlkD